MASSEAREQARRAIAVKLHESGYTEKEVKHITEIILEEYNGLPLGWIDLVDTFINLGYTREDSLLIVYLSFKALRHDL